MSYPAPIRHPLVEEYRCQDCGGPDGQRCQLLIEHDLPHIASVKDTFVGWMDGGRGSTTARTVPLGAVVPVGDER